MGNIGGMLMMDNRDYTQVVVAVMPCNKAGFGEDDGNAVFERPLFELPASPMK